jgi:hypothetical protein
MIDNDHLGGGMSTAPAQPEGDPFTVGLTTAAAVLLGSAAVLVSTGLTSDFLRLLLGLVIAGYGVVTWRGAAVSDLGRPRPLGVPVERALGAGAALFGVDLVATAVVASIVNAASEEFTPPSPTLLTVIRYGLPLAVLAAMAFGGLAAGPVGVGVVLPTAVAAVLVVDVPDAQTIAVVMFVIAVVALPLALAPGNGPWSRFATVASAVAVSFAVGAGTSPLSALGVVTGQAGPSSPRVNLVVPVLGLAIAAVLLAVAVHRRAVAGGLVAPLLFAAPPVAFTGPAPVAGSAALLIVPVAVVVFALVAWTTRRLPRPVALAAAGIALLVFAVQALPTLGWPDRVVGVVALVVFAVIALLAWRLPGLPGAVVAGAVLIALVVATPWHRVFLGQEPGSVSFVVSGLVGVLAAGAAVWVLVKRHPRPGVIAAAAYCAAGTLAHSLFSFAAAAAVTSVRWAALIEFGPLLVIGAIAAMFALRGRLLAAAQAAGAVVLAAGTFVMVVLIALTAGLSRARYGIDVIIAPLAPTNVNTWMLDKSDGFLLAGVVLLIVLAAVFAVTLARRASAPLATAAGLTAVIGAQCAAALTQDDDPPIGLGPLAAIVLVCAIACACVAAGAGRRFRHRRPEPAQPLPQE